MIANIKPELINQEILKNRIESLEAGYVDSLITLIQWPQFIEACAKDLLEEDITPDRKKSLEEALNKNKIAMKGHSESIDQLNKTITEARTYLNK